MRLARSVVALAIVLATTTSYSSLVYADDTTTVSTQAPTDTATPIPSTALVAAPSESVTVHQGDTLTAIATTYGTTVDSILAKNDITDPNMISAGQVLELPGQTAGLAGFSGSLKAAAEAFITPPAPAPVVQTAAVTYTASSTPISHTSSAGNTYAWGYCTWYVKERIPSLPNQLGNGGYGWLSRAASYGYATGSVPRSGAVGVESGHVVVVDSVNSNGTVNISEMNYGGGLGVVHHRTTAASEFQYIYT